MTNKKSVQLSYGFYLVSYLHVGSNPQCYFGIITINNFEDENILRTAKNIIPNGNEIYELQYNSYSGEVKLIEDVTGQYIFCKLI